MLLAPRLRQAKLPGTGESEQIENRPGPFFELLTADSHRRLPRSAASAISQAAERVQSHHGSDLPKLQFTPLAMAGIGGGGQQACRQTQMQNSRSTEDWLCKICVGPDHTQFRNFGTRTACFKCGMAKAHCFEGKVQKTGRGGGPASSLAERQAQMQGHQSSTTGWADGEVRRLKDDNKKLKDAASAAAATGNPGAAAGSVPEDEEDSRTSAGITYLEGAIKHAKAAGQPLPRIQMFEEELAGLRASLKKAKPPATRREQATKKLRWKEADIAKTAKIIEEDKAALSKLQDKISEAQAKQAR